MLSFAMCAEGASEIWIFGNDPKLMKSFSLCIIISCCGQPKGRRGFYTAAAATGQ
jgi:hypothetical protein